MKRLIFFLFLLFCFPLLKAQIFAPIGSTWGYNYNSLGGPGSIYLNAVADTIIKGYTCRKLTYEDKSLFSYNNYRDIFYLHERNDSLFGVSRDGSNFNLLFQYSLKVGDTLTYNNYYKSQYLTTRRIDTLISGQTLKKWELAEICKDFRTPYSRLNFIEKIGAERDIIGFQNYCNPAGENTYFDICSYSSGNINICIFSGRIAIILKADNILLGT